ncbi:hypothetical protein SAMN02745857_03813 [Andreprevotia lacus DSM 23236]|jgi:hypothetical protein|uniref:Uncharacterized protein n=1 Tax=Andreprevotia lacus DSM 23236 TaxID=1121001 RepID=A0A1W1XZU8_9NEIS|nr:hypothetical protein [Andreprevotia lacus]SMC29397.1 hypothetical protein SAMN02745857_03813 [Andreprevotia lacus DSM 23236]
MLRVLRSLFLVMLIAALPFNGAIASLARVQQALAEHPISVPSAPVLHEHRGMFGVVELHLHTAADSGKLECGKFCNSLGQLMPDGYEQPQPHWQLSNWSPATQQFPGDHLSAPPEQPPKSRA